MRGRRKIRTCLDALCTFIVRMQSFNIWERIYLGNGGQRAFHTVKSKGCTMTEGELYSQDPLHSCTTSLRATTLCEV